MLHCVHDYRGVIAFDPCQLVTLVSSSMQHTSVCLMLCWAPACLSMNILTHACLSMNILTHAIYTGMKPYWCTIAHQTQNSARFSPWNWGIFFRILTMKAWWEYCFVFYDAPDLKCYQIFAMKIRWNSARLSLWKFGNNSKCASKALIKATPLSKINPQNPILLKPQKLMSIDCFQLPTTKN